MIAYATINGIDVAYVVIGLVLLFILNRYCALLDRRKALDRRWAARRRRLDLNRLSWRHRHHWWEA